MNNKKFDFMESLVMIKDQINLETSIRNIAKELLDEGFDLNEINEFILIKVKQSLASVE